MENEQVIQRDVSSVQTVQYRQNSPTHKAGLILEPGHWEAFDPFLLMAEDWFERGTFGQHPHRGIETVTYVIDGRLEHYDNHGGRSELLPGDVQWMTAGRGVIHSEEPARGETVHTLQLWVNLPSQKKMAEPRYQNLRGADMPIRQEEGATIRIFSGSSKGITAETKNHVPVTMVELTLDAGAIVSLDLPGDYNGFIYVLNGRGFFGHSQKEAGQSQVVWLGLEAAGQDSELIVRATEPLKAILYAGKPLREPVVARGPFVMNTEEQIRQAYLDYQAGKFNV